jgi:hypothetical protein
MITVSSLVHLMDAFNGPSKKKNVPHTESYKIVLIQRIIFSKDLEFHPENFWHCMQNEMIHSQNFTKTTTS